VKIILFIKFIMGWLLVKENRASGIRSLFKVLNILQKLSKLTESKKDDKFIESTKILIGKLLQEIPPHFRDEAILNINETKEGLLKNIEIGYDSKNGVNAGISIKF
jgi:hypothetical protein